MNAYGSGEQKMGDSFSSDVEYLVFSVNRKQYGLPHFNVVSIMDIPAHTAIASAGPEMRGVIPFREQSIPLIDLRVCLGENSRLQEIEELIDNMAQRKQDHINWLNNLKSQVINKQPITVQTDPHKCAFGKWYDRFASDNANLNAYMRNFDKPHQAIHHVASEAERLIQQGRPEDARTLIQATEEGVLAKLLKLFEGLGEVVRKYLLEYAIILADEERMLAVAVDDINFFNRLEQVRSRSETRVIKNSSEMVQAVGRFKESEKDDWRNVLLLDAGRIGAQGSLEAEFM